MQLDDTPGDKIIKDPLGVLRPIADSLRKVSRVDEIEGLPGPRVFYIVDFEGAVWRNPYRLDRTQVNSDDFTFRVLTVSNVSRRESMCLFGLSN